MLSMKQNNAGSKFRFNYGTSSNKYYWGIASNYRIAETTVTVDNLKPDTIIWVGTVFNKQYNWITDCQSKSGVYDVETVALHEFGHWLCVKDEPYRSDYVMYYQYIGCKRSLTTADKDAIKSIYGV